MVINESVDTGAQNLNELAPGPYDNNEPLDTELI